MVEIWNSKLEVTWSTQDKMVLDAAVALTERNQQPAYLQEVLLFLHQHSQALFVMVSKKGPAPEEMTTLAMLFDGNLVSEPLTYSLVGTPCENVQKHLISYIPVKVQALFPTNDYLSRFGIESYFGAPLLGSAGNITGLVTIMHHAPLANPKLLELILTILSPPLEALMEMSF